MRLEIDTSDLDSQFDEEFERIKQATRESMRYAGEVYTAESREKGSYKDQTGHLRAANSYGIAENGNLTEDNTQAESDTGENDTLVGMNQQDLSGDMVLVLANGKDYASNVEAKGYDVSSSGQLAAEKILKKLL